MSTEKLNALQSGMNSKPTGQGNIALGVDEGGTPRIPEELSILPVRGLVVFPGTVIPLNVQRAASLKLLDDTLLRTKVIGLLTQRDETQEDPSPQDLYSVGTAALVLKLVRQSEDNVLVIVQGLRRFSLRKIVATDPFLRAEIDLPQSILPPPSKEWEAMFRNLRDSAARLFELTPDAPEQARIMIMNIENPEQLADFLAPNLNIDFAQKQALLDELDVENGCVPCSNTFRRSLRSPRSNSDYKKMSRRNFPMRNDVRISVRSSKRSSMSWVRMRAAARNKRNNCARACRKRIRRKK